MPKAFGIDFGTCNSFIAVSENCKIDVKLSRSNERSTPSVFAFRNGEIAVGEDALSRKSEIIPDIKRILGLPYNSEIVQRYIKDYCIKLKNVNEVPMFTMPHNQEVKLEIETLVAMLFSELKHGQKSVDKAVITVPASYKDEQRKIITDAAAIADIGDVKLIEETTAAAVALTKTRPNPGKNTTLIFQLGGSTIDVAIFNVKETLVTVLGNACSSNFGGIDFDRTLLDHIAQRLKKTVGDNDRRELLYLCMKAKEKLGEADTAEVIHTAWNIQLSKGELETVFMSLLEQIEIMIEMAKQAAKVEQIDEYLLIGQGCLIPHVKNYIQRKLEEGNQSSALDIKEAAVTGASMYAEIDKQEKKIEIYDQRVNDIFITIEDGQISCSNEQGTGKDEAQISLSETLSSLQQVNSKDLNMKITVRARDKETCIGPSSQTRPQRSHGRAIWFSSSYGKKKETTKISELRGKVRKHIEENSETLKRERRVELLNRNATTLLRKSQNQKEEIEEVIVICNETIDRIKYSPLSEEELNKRETILSEKMALLAKEEPKNISERLRTLLHGISAFFRRLCCWCHNCCCCCCCWEGLNCCLCKTDENGTRADSTRLMNSAEN